MAIRADGGAPPLFCVHAEAGHLRPYEGLVHHLDVPVPVYGLRAVPQAGSAVPYRSFEEVAARYARQMRDVYRSGPCLIVGECSGGLLAYELAQQLRSCGHDVPLLVLIDAPAPGWPRHRPGVGDGAYRAVQRAHTLSVHWQNLRSIDANARAAYVRDRASRAINCAKRKAFPPPGTTPPGPDLAHAFGEARRAYVPEPYPGRVVLLRAATLPWGIQRADDLGWGALVADLRVEEVQGYFGMTLVGPNVEGVAEQLSYHVRETLRHALADGTGAKSPAQADRDAPKRTGMRA